MTLGSTISAPLFTRPPILGEIMAKLIETENGGTRFVHDHESIPALPCSRRPTHHLRTNNLLALQAYYACGTLHHKCSGVSLAKATDTNPHVSGTRTPRDRVTPYMRQWHGPLAEQTRADMATNDLRGLSTLIYLATNDPTPGA